MAEFKLICIQCGSDNVLEKTRREVLELQDGKNKYAEGVQRKCLDCSSEAFSIFRTWSTDHPVTSEDPR